MYHKKIPVLLIFLIIEIHPRKWQEAIYPSHRRQGGTGFWAADPPSVNGHLDSAHLVTWPPVTERNSL